MTHDPRDVEDVRGAGVEDFPPMSGDGSSPPPGSVNRPFPEIDGYEIVTLLGEGGMGVVWQAVQRSTRRQVALKLMSNRLFESDPNRQRRFEREIELAAQLEHPNIARVYDSGLQRGLRYYAMELVQGETLGNYLRKRVAGQTRLLQIMQGICYAVEHAHQHGVIHRDLKPSNIMVDAYGQPRLLDFGLAGSIADDRKIDTMTMEAIGTICYMSPEQARGDVKKITTRSDVYALGVILYEMLTGHLPHDAEGAPLMVLRRVAEEPVRLPRRFVATLSQELEAILLKALAQEPAQRYATPGELAADIRRYLDGEVVLARRPTAAYLLGKWLKRHRARVIVALMIVTTLLATTVVAYVNINEARIQAQAEARLAREALYFNSITLAHSRIRENNVAEAQRILDECPPELRDWEWQHLRHLSDSSAMALNANGYRVLAVAQNSNGDIVALSIDQHVRVWDPATGELLSERPFAEAITGPALITADGRHLVGRTASGVLGVWECSSSVMVSILSEALERIRSLAVSADGQRVAALTMDRQVTVWKLRTGEVLFAEIVGESINLIELNANGSMLLGAGGQLQLWDVDAPHRIAQSDRLEAHVQAAAFCAFTQRIVTALDTGDCDVWTVPGLTRVARLIGHEGPIHAVMFQSDGGTIATAGADQTMRLWHADHGRQLEIHRGHTDAIRLLGIGVDGQWVTAGNRGQIRLWDKPAQQKTLLSSVGDIGTTTGVATLEAGLRLAWVGKEGLCMIRDFANDETLTLPSPISAVRHLAFSVDGSHLALDGSDGVVRVWDVEQKQVRAALNTSRKLQALAFSPDGSMLAAVGRASSGVQIWDVKQGVLVDTVEHGRSPIAWASDAQHLVVTDRRNAEGQFLVWTRATGSSKAIQIDFAGRLRSLKAGPTAKAMGIGTEDGWLHLFNLSGDVLHEFRPFTNEPVNDFAFSDDAKRIAILGNSVTVWGLKDDQGLEILNLGPVNHAFEGQVFFSADQSTLFALTAGTLYQWQAPSY